MISSSRTETETRRFDSAAGESPLTDRETRYVFTGSGRLSVCASTIEFADPYGEPNRQLLTVWLDGDELPAAVVDWLAHLHQGATTEYNERLRQSCTEKLQRFAGAMGLEYVATPKETPVAA